MYSDKLVDFLVEADFAKSINEAKDFIRQHQVCVLNIHTQNLRTITTLSEVLPKEYCQLICGEGAVATTYDGSMWFAQYLPKGAPKTIAIYDRCIAGCEYIIPKENVPEAFKEIIKKVKVARYDATVMLAKTTCSEIIRIYFFHFKVTEKGILAPAYYWVTIGLSLYDYLQYDKYLQHTIAERALDDFYYSINNNR